jgi:hypothetical protein
MIFGQLWGEPWDGKNSRFLQGLTTGPHHIQVTGGDLLPVPGPIGTQLARRATLDLIEKPQCACRRPAQTKRMGANDALPLTALSSPQPIKGVGVANGHFHGPAAAILVDDVGGASRPLSGAKGFDGWGWFSLPGLFGGDFAITPQHHNPHEAPRQPRVPQAIPDLERGARFAGVR